MIRDTIVGAPQGCVVTCEDTAVPESRQPSVSTVPTASTIGDRTDMKMPGTSRVAAENKDRLPLPVLRTPSKGSNAPHPISSKPSRASGDTSTSHATSSPSKGAQAFIIHLTNSTANLGRIHDEVGKLTGPSSSSEDTSSWQKIAHPQIPLTHTLM